MKKAEIERVHRRIGLVLRRVAFWVPTFYLSLFRCNVTEEIPTVKILDGEISINPKFAASVTNDHLQGVLIHELTHYLETVK